VGIAQLVRASPCQGEGWEFKSPCPLQFMTDFEALLNKEIVESGFVPDSSIIDRALELGALLEEHFSDVNTLKPVLTEGSNTITYFDKDEDGGFALYISFNRREYKVDEELVRWTKDFNASIRGKLTKEDFEYVFSRR
jgi:hypothetical protein